MTLSFEKHDENFLQNLSISSIPEVVAAVKRLKVDVERLSMENKWMKSYLERSSDNDIFKKRRSMSSELRATSKSVKSLDSSKKTELCEQEVFKIERETRKIEIENAKEMKKLVAEAYDAQITQKELENIVNEMKTRISIEISDPKTYKGSTSKFVEKMMKDCSAIETLMLIKTETLKKDFRKLKPKVMKREELKSCLQPIDFDLLTIQKDKLKKVEEKKKGYILAINQTLFPMASSINHGQKQLDEAEAKLVELIKIRENSEKNVDAMKSEVLTLNNDIEAIKASIRKLTNLNEVCDAPSISSYITKLSERDNICQMMKCLERKHRATKTSWQIVKSSKQV